MSNDTSDTVMCMARDARTGRPCENHATSTGTLCTAHYRAFLADVKNGLYTWRELADAGMCTLPKSKSRADVRAITDSIREYMRKRKDANA